MASNNIRNIVLFGAGGQLGKHVLKALIANSELSVTVLAREDSNSTYPPHIPVIRTDFSASSLEAALKGQDAVVSTVTHLALKEQEKVLHAAVKSGVQRFIPSEFGSDTSNDALLRAVPYSAIKRRVIDQLMQLEGMGPKAYFSWTTVIPGPFFEWVLEPGAFGFNTTKRTATLYDGGDIPFSTTKLSTIGDAIVGILRNPDATRNKYVFVRSALTTHAQLLANLEKATACKWKVEHDSVSRVRQQGQDRMAKGDFMGNLDLIRAAILTPGTGFDFASMNDILGLSGDQYVDSLVSEYLANLAPS